MTTTAQPLNFKRLVIAFVMVCIWLAFYATLRTMIWTNQHTTSYRPIYKSSSSMFLWIGLLIFLYASIDNVFMLAIVSTCCWSNIIRMIVSPATYSGSTFIGILQSPCPSLEFVPAKVGTESISRIKWCEINITFTALFMTHNLLSISRKTSKASEYFAGTASPNSRWIKNQRKGNNVNGSSNKYPVSSITIGKGPKDCANRLNFVGRFTEKWMRKFPLIDLKGEIPNKAEASILMHRERLNEETSLMDGVIVRTIREMNRMRLTEMFNPLQFVV